MAGGSVIFAEDFSNEISKPNGKYIMLWPLLLPFKITFWLFAGIIGVFVLLAPKLKWKREKVAWISLGVGVVAFVPACTGVMKIVDHQRFGIFEFSAYEEIEDFRKQRYLPPQAQNIQMHFNFMSSEARYEISEKDLLEYVDHLWERYGEYSSIKRNEYFGVASQASKKDIENRFQGTGWEYSENIFQIESPMEGDGGGATYFYDRDAGVVLQSTNFW